MKHLAVLLLFAACLLSAQQDEIMLFDFRNKNTCGWFGNHDIASVTPTDEGLHAVSSGREDPWIEGPVIPKLPDGDYDKIILEIRYKGTGKSIQIFYGPQFTPLRQANVRGKGTNEWTTERLVIPRPTDDSRLRIDPCMFAGEITVATIKAIPLPTLFTPSSRKPSPIIVDDDAAILTSGSLTIRHAPDKWDAYVVENNRIPIACAHDEPLFACLVNGKTEIFNLTKDAYTTISHTTSSLTVTAIFKDSGNAEWTAVRTFMAAHSNAVNITTSIRVSEDRQLVQMPWITLFPGLGTFGTRKTQALLAGVEYLVDEPSSDCKDFAPQQANRRMVNNYKLCFPLMAISYKKQWLSLSWDYGKFPATIFDSPDRLFHSDAHLFALWSPSPRQDRMENDVNVYRAFPIYKNIPLKLETTITVGEGDGTIAPAIADYLERNPLPPLPIYEDGFQGALNLAAHGWLDSVIHVDNQWRHAYTRGTGHPPRNAFDPIVLMDYIAQKTTDKFMSKRLQDCIVQTLPSYPINNYGNSVTHNYQNLFSYLYQSAAENWLKAVYPSANQQLDRLRPDGSYPYRPAPPDVKFNYGTTHWADHANGLTASSLLGASRFVLASANPSVREKYLTIIDRVFDCYRNDVPRGAQTWEIPLHSPDILGSAYMLVLAATAYKISGNPKYLKEAEYWALTGVPFVYLVNPVEHLNPKGLYGTIAVLGATFWTASNWIGLPVQWCGAVYRNALYEYLDILDDPAKQAFWKKIADGITITGLQFTYQERDGDPADQIGLLPDSYRLMMGMKGGPSINPGTIQLFMPQAYGETPIINVKMLKIGRFIHALGDIKTISDSQAELDLWPARPTDVLITGLAAKPSEIRWQGKSIQFKWLPEHNAFIANIQGKGMLEWR
ncbi:MAG: hypothetical protein J6X49_07015 [Victivallales bacterium]|nr:hypothetical protein [Victivallales bacterium]